VAVDLKALGFGGQVTVRDLWKHAGAGTFRHHYAQRIPAHGAALLRITGP
jgi:alpha-galactosidase